MFIRESKAFNYLLNKAFRRSTEEIDEKRSCSGVDDSVQKKKQYNQCKIERKGNSVQREACIVDLCIAQWFLLFLQCQTNC